MNKVINRISASGLSTLASCQYKYYLKYEEGLPDEEKSWLDRGSVFHSLMEQFLHKVYHEQLKQPARNTPIKQSVLDDFIEFIAHYNVVRRAEYPQYPEIVDEAINLFLFHAPKLGIGTRYFVAEEQVSDTETRPLIEYKFHVVMENIQVNGYMDAILWDTETEQFLLVDWKLRKNFYDAMAIFLDKQVHLYAYVCKTFLRFENITQAHYQLSSTLPALPKKLEGKTINKATGLSSADTYTIDGWSTTIAKTTLPTLVDWGKQYGITEDEIKAKWGEKLADESDYRELTIIPASDEAEQSVLELIQQARDTTKFNRTMSSYTCKDCSFLVECGTRLMHTPQRNVVSVDEISTN